MKDNEITNLFKEQVDNLDLKTISELNKSRNSILNQNLKTQTQNKTYFKYAFASLLPCILTVGLYFNLNPTETEEVDLAFMDVIVNETISEDYVYATTDSEFLEILSIDSIYLNN